MSEHNINYDNKLKNDWRGWCWNRISERIPKPKDAVCLYLAGPKNIDLRVAEKKGFRRENLVAVERDPSTLSFLRSQGQLTIDGDIFEAAKSWPASKKLDVLIADLTSGVYASTLFAVSEIALSRPGIVIALNLLAGRDSLVGKIKGFDKELFEFCGGGHRGTLVHTWYLHSLSQELLPLFPEKPLMKPHVIKLLRSKAAFNSYISPESGQRFDSVVFGSLFANEFLSPLTLGLFITDRKRLSANCSRRVTLSTKACAAIHTSRTSCK